jgi:hypothetical protein
VHNLAQTKISAVHGSRITITNHYYLEEIGFDPQTREQPVPTPQPVCIPDASWSETKPPRLSFAFQAEQETRFSAAPDEHYSRAASRTKMHKPKTAATRRYPDS